jgi:hypothetical protein
MKVVNRELGHIDYTSGTRGIRVRPEACHAIRSFAERWSEYGPTEHLPMTPEALRLPLESPAWTSPIAECLKQYERRRHNDPGKEDKTELRRLLLGLCPFDLALKP